MPGTLEISKILVRGAQLTAVRLDDAAGSPAVKLVEETRQKQNQLRQLKNVDQKRLKMVVQL